MTHKQRVACFFTGGYSELNAMKSFFRKANDHVDLIQLCPTGERRSKSQITGRHTDNIRKSQSGLTGTSLIDFVLDFIKTPRFLTEEYDAILIEDDKDSRFLTPLSNGNANIDSVAWEEYRQSIFAAVKESGVTIPVIIVLAAPEVEAWFLSDWEKSFGTVFSEDFTKEQNEYFSVTFRRYINQSILTEQYRDSVEAYGYFNGAYRKLSEKIQAALDSTDFLESFKPDEQHFIPRYSKRIQGEVMLRAIDPNQVLQHCTVFLKSGLLQLQALSDDVSL